MNARRAVAIARHLGNRYRCPICGWRFRRLEPGGSTRRPDASCPRCGSLERHRHLWLFMQKRTDLFSRPDLRMLHIAPEPFFERWLRRIPGLDYLSGDIESGKAMEVIDLTAIDKPDQSFDCVLCIHVLAEIGDDTRAMAEVHRVLAPGGWALMPVPIWPWDTQEYLDADPETRKARFGDASIIRVYGRDEYVRRLESVGFDVSAESYVPDLDERERARIVPEGWDPDDPNLYELFICKRRSR